MENIVLRWKERLLEDERTLYFVKQKILGGVIAASAMIPSLIFRDVVSVILFLPVMALGVTMAVVDKMFIMNDYYWTHGGADQWDDEDWNE